MTHMTGIVFDRVQVMPCEIQTIKLGKPGDCVHIPGQ